MRRNILQKSLIQVKYILIVFLSASIFVSSCARKINFATSTIVPAAEGTVKIKEDKNNNYAVDVEVRHLAEPNKLPMSKNVYVVWVETERNGVQNLGQLNTSSGLLSSTLKASLQAVTPYKPTRLFITGEDAATVQYPGNYVVLNTTSF